MASTDPEFEEKAADVIGLYLKPPLNAAVFCVDEKSAASRWRFSTSLSVISSSVRSPQIGVDPTVVSPAAIWIAES